MDLMNSFYKNADKCMMEEIGMNNDLVSIIIPIYNAESYLTVCLDSLVNQSYKHIEIILINDGSTDDSGKICRFYEKKFPFVRYYQQKNQGQNAARLNGIRKATGEWIILVDADDFVSNDMCNILMSKQQELRVDMVIGGAQRFFFGKNKIMRTVKVDPPIQTAIKVAERCVMNYGRSGAPLPLWGILYRKKDILDALETIDLNITFGEDCACILFVLSRIEKVYWAEECIYNYRVSNSSFTQRHGKEIISEQSRMLLYWNKVFNGLDEWHHIKTFCDKFVIRNLMLGGFEWFYDFPGIYPFAKIDDGKRIALYGAGILGEEIRKKVSERYIITGVFDKAYKDYQKMGRDVRNPVELVDEKCDYVLVAIWNKVVAEKVAQELRQSYKDKIILTVDDDILDSEYTIKKIEDLRNYVSRM